MLATYGFSVPTDIRIRTRIGIEQRGFTTVDLITISAPVVARLVLAEACLTCRGWKWCLADMACLMADKEAMLRPFAPTISQDGQIGVDRDTMMMGSAMPSTLGCVLHVSPFFI